MAAKTPPHATPIKIALFVAFGLVVLAVGYKALSMSTDTRSKASSACYGTLKPSKRKVCRNEKNQKGGTVQKCHDEIVYNCVKKTIQQVGGNTGQVQYVPKKSPTPTPVKTLQEAP